MSLLTRGQLIRDFCLPASDGRDTFLSDKRGRRNMVLVLAGDSAELSVHALLEAAAQQYARIAGAEGMLAVVFAMPGETMRDVTQRQGWRFPVFADANGDVHRRLGAMTDHRLTPAVYVTDRFGEVYASFAEPMPSLDEIVSWLDFVSIQCEECFPSEWPD
jgi:peroxiredoxin